MIGFWNKFRRPAKKRPVRCIIEQDVLFICLYFLGCELRSAGSVYYDAGAHGGADGDRFDVLAFGGCGLSLNERAKASFKVLKKLLVGEVDLADGEVNDTGFVSTIFDAGSSLDFLYCGTDVVGYGAVSLVGSSWSEHSSDLTDLGCHFFRCKKNIEISEASLNLSDELISSDRVGSCSFGLSSEIAFRKDSNLSNLTGAVRKVGDTANVLVALSWVDTEVNGEVHALNEFGVCSLLDECEGSYDVKNGVFLNGLGNGGVAWRMGILSYVCSQCISPVVQADGDVLPRIWKGKYTAGCDLSAFRFKQSR